MADTAPANAPAAGGERRAPREDGDRRGGRGGFGGRGGPRKEDWTPKTKLGRLVAANHIESLEEIYAPRVSGNLETDGYGLRYFLNQGFQMVIAQSFAKIMGLYGERTGALHFVCNNKADADRLLSQIKIIVRSNYSSPPKHGARIASIILNEPAMRA